MCPMQPQQAAPGDRRPSSQPLGARSDAGRLRAACRRQAEAVDTLGDAVSGGDGQSRDEVHGAERVEVALPLDAAAAAAARTVVQGLGGRLPPSLLEDARLVVSELVTNSVRHSGAPAPAVVVLRVELTPGMVRVEVDDPGCDGVVAPRAPDFVNGGGFGLNLVRALSERWGLERIAAGGTRVWAQLALAPVTAGADD